MSVMAIGFIGENYADDFERRGYAVVRSALEEPSRLTEVIHFCYTIKCMATLKKRVNISIPKSAEDALKRLAKRDQVPQATKAAELFRYALELEEDRVFDRIAAGRDSSGSKLLSHKEVWK